MMGHAHTSSSGSKKVLRTDNCWRMMLVPVLGLTTEDNGTG